MSERKAIGPEVRRLRKQLDADDGALNVEAPIPGAEKVGDEAMAELRPELYEKIALLIPFAVDGLIDEFPSELFLKKDFKGPELHEAMVESAEKFILKDFYLPEDAPEGYKATSERVRRLVARAHELEPKKSIYKSPRYFMLGGINTALKFSTGSLVGIRAKARNRDQFSTQEDLFNLMKRSYRLTTSIMMANIDQIDPILRSIMASRGGGEVERTKTPPCVNPNLLRFYPSEEDPNCYVDYIEPLEQMIDPRVLESIHDISKRFPTIGCPAAFGDGYKKLYEWNAEIYSGVAFKK